MVRPLRIIEHLYHERAKTRKQRGGDIFNMFRSKVIPPKVNWSTRANETLPPMPDLNTLKKGEIDHILLSLTTDLKQNMENCYKECESIITDDEILNQAKSQRLSGYALQFMNTCNMYYSMPGNEGIKTTHKKCDFIRPRLYRIEELYNKASSLLKQLTTKTTPEDDTNRIEVFEEIIAKIKQIFIQGKIYHPTINNDPLLKVHQQPGSRALNIPVSIEVGGENSETSASMMQENSTNRHFYTLAPNKRFHMKNMKPRFYTQKQNRRRSTKNKPPLGTAKPIPNVSLNPQQLLRIGPEPSLPNILKPTLTKTKGSRTLVNRNNTNLNEPNTNLKEKSAFIPTQARRGAGRKTQRRRRNQS